MFSIIAPMDTNRLEQFTHTKRAYDAMPQEKEIIIPTRSYAEVYKYLKENDLLKDVIMLPYEHDKGFNPSMALNLGLEEAKYDNIIITSPEVKPKTNVLEQLSERLDRNVVCQVYDEDFEGKLTSLVNTSYRSESPAMYFLAMFRKEDVKKINGWDEDFMLGYAYEDNDFGDRWVRAGLPFEVRDEIQAIHQYHPRTETIRNGATINQDKYYWNKDNQVIRPKNGLIKEG